VDIQFFQHHLLKRRLFPTICFGLFYQESNGCSSVNLCLGFLFFFISLHVCFCASTILSY
jgi:hypothetical protein